MKRYLENFKHCLQKEVPFCQAECPFHIDELDFIEKLRRGSFNAAFKTYRNAVGFPAIVAKLCDAPCENVCPRHKTDRPINLHLLENACVDYTKNTDPADYNLPKKEGRIAIIGAGISGLACALRLATKKYDVTVFEKTGRIGGHLWGFADPELFLADIEQQFKFEDYELRLNTEITTLSELDGFDAIYVATGLQGENFSLLKEAEPCRYEGKTGVFAGGSLLGKSTIYAIADGLNMSTTIDNFLKTGNLIYTKEKNDTSMCLDPSHSTKTDPVQPTADGKFTKEEAVDEANRCMECQCDACRIHCDLTGYFNKWPLRIRDEIQATTLPGTAEVKATPAKRLISTCTQCGLCLETCPEDIDMGGLILAARKSMHSQQKAPWPFHDFWIRDMEFSNSDQASLVKVSFDQVDQECKYAFFPGCQIGSSNPELVIKSYKYLIQKEPRTGLILSCCGVPASWAGDEDKFNNVLKQLENDWKSLGKPTLVLACPTCNRTFAEHLPQIPRVFLYELMADWGVDSPTKDERVFSVFDPCSTRGMDHVRDAVRSIAGVQLQPLTHQEKHSHCCGHGGQVAIANPEFADFVVKKRISESENPYITYCINCRDVFLHEGKESLHILDLIFDHKSPTTLPTVSERRENRIELKKTMLKKFWGEEMEIEKKEYDFNLVISETLKEKLDKQRILEEEVLNVIDFCESSKRTIYDTEDNTYSGYRQIGRMTYWVTYRKTEDFIELVNAYCHRMKIELEAVWNGKKVDLEMQ